MEEGFLQGRAKSCNGNHHSRRCSTDMAQLVRVNDANGLGRGPLGHNRTDSVLLSRYLEKPFVTFGGVGASNSA